ncbi:hypothetical protein CDG77_17425 [Nostoc sp. 'Peltigera membranacea cyanobiont' 213]|uniref:DUF3455 domain-containing protein n=1 Tax=unclassified Nostoc TaxID=2593658 RepID=UPI000B951E5C|nr:MULTISPECIES: DUF3455 domain-containing protein [unclassified Nostoc]AVH62278.1 protein of unknown function DUF3455 [Nostoc sp. 'Peltigera membranacea cyanobiont' N6]OYD90195.1 hypothetical protein CDG77_17425 [Nostoc sp. 'Peltigera membranacea cyanobiont' 213]
MPPTFYKIVQINCSLVFSLLMLNGWGVSSKTAIAGTMEPAQRTEDVVAIPDSIKVPNGEQLLLKASAKGSQIYICKLKSESPEQYEWTLKAPDAVLLNEQGQDLGKHYAGPTWEAKDGSKVVGKLKSKADAPQEDAIPWLLLEAQSHQGNGIFRQVNWIQRINTVGGKAPVKGCDKSSQNQEIPVNYTADYLFYNIKQ